MIIGIFKSCCNPSAINYRLIAINGKVEKIISAEELNYVNEEIYLTEPYNPLLGAIPFDSIGIVINMDVEKYTYTKTGDVLNSAIACSPNENYEFLKDLIITTDNDYNSSFPKGEDLKQLISIRSSLINQYRVKGESVEDFLKIPGIGDESFFLTFKEPPDQNFTYNFSIKFILVDGREYSTVIENITISQ